MNVAVPMPKWSVVCLNQCGTSAAPAAATSVDSPSAVSREGMVRRWMVLAAAER